MVLVGHNNRLLTVHFQTQISKSNIDCLGAELEVLPQGLPAGLVWLNMAKNELTEVGFLPNSSN